MRIEPIHTLPSPLRGLAAFRVELADGRVLKARRLADEREAERVGRLLEEAGLAFPSPLARFGIALLEPWIEGTLLAEIPEISDSISERCGAILADLHRLPFPAWRSRPTRGEPAAVARRLGDELALLVEIDAVEAGLADRISRAALAAKPDEGSLGIVHGDFCAENIVLTSAGDLFIIDNATLHFAAHDFDLARCWYRWPMRRAETEAFLRGYERIRSADGFRRHFPFWATSVLVAAAFNRHRTRSGDFAVPLARLRGLMTSLESGVREPWKAEA